MRPAIIEAWIQDVNRAKPTVSPRSAHETLTSPRHNPPVFDSPTTSPPAKRRRVLGDLPSSSLNSQIMMASQDPLDASARKPPRRSPRTPSPTKRQAAQKLDGEARIVEGGGLGDETPRATKPRRGNTFAAHERLVPSAGAAMPPHDTYSDSLARAEPPEASLPSRNTSSHTSTSGTSSFKRNSSPVKRTAALQDVGSGIHYRGLSDSGRELGTGNQKLLRDLRAAAEGIGVIPAAIANVVEDEIRIRADTIDKEATDVDFSREELRAVRKLNSASKRCERRFESEPEWNVAVHSVLLRLALGDDPSNPVVFRTM